MGLETISYRAPQLWNLVPTDIKDVLSLSKFKKKIKSWYSGSCPCRLCKTYIASVTFKLQNLAHDINFFSCVFSVSPFIDARCKLVL